MDKKDQSDTDNFRKYFHIIFGKRTVKTGIAVALSLWISRLVGLKMHSMVMLAAITSMRSSIFESWHDSVNRMYSTFIGIILGSLFQYIGFTNYIAIVVGIIIIINITNYLKWNDATNLALMVFCTVLIYVPDQPVGDPDHMNYVTYSIHRAQDTLIGLGIGFAINYLVFPPKKEEIFVHIYKNAKKEMDQVLEKFLRGEDVDTSILADHIEIMAKELPYNRENALGKNIDIRTSELARINANFTSAFGMISRFAEDEKIPYLTVDNLRSIRDYFGEEIVPAQEETNEVYTTAFNYYFDELMKQLEEITNVIGRIERQVSK